MSTLTFYTTAGCHLCEHAAEMLTHLQQQTDVAVEEIDIASDEALVERYGIRIPVIRREPDGKEIGWPFSYEELASLA